MGAQERQVHAKVRLLEEALLTGVESEDKRSQDDKDHDQLDQWHGHWQPQKEKPGLPRERASLTPEGQPQEGVRRLEEGDCGHGGGDEVGHTDALRRCDRQ